MSEYTEQVVELHDQITDILSSGQSSGELTLWHEKELTDLLKEVDTPTKQSVFQLTYVDNLDNCATIEEIRFMMGLCEVPTFTMSL